MPQFLSAISFHHSNASSGGKDLYEAQDLEEAILFGFRIAFIEVGLDTDFLWEEHKETIKKALREARETGKDVPVSFYTTDDPERTEDEDRATAVVWDKTENGKRNLGLCQVYPGYEPDRHDSVWLDVQPWAPSATAMHNLCARYTKEDLARALLAAADVAPGISDVLKYLP